MLCNRIVLAGHPGADDHSTTVGEASDEALETMIGDLLCRFQTYLLAPKHWFNSFDNPRCISFGVNEALEFVF